MTTFTIDKDDNITALSSAAEAKRDAETERFQSAKELAKLAAKWPASRLVEIWNSLPGVRPVAKFTSRQTAVTRIWAAIQNLSPEDGAQAARVGPKRGSATKRTSVAPEAREGSKTETVLHLLKRREGATLTELMAVTKWQAHSVRGFLSGTLRKKMGLNVESSKSADGERTYSIHA